jgi:hypothetical protein
MQISIKQNNIYKISELTEGLWFYGNHIYLVGKEKPILHDNVWLNIFYIKSTMVNDSCGNIYGTGWNYAEFTKFDGQITLKS